MSNPYAIPELPVLYEDDLILAVNKPSGLLSQPGKVEPDSVLTRVLAHRREIVGPALVHRLDMDTSGILLLAKNRAAHRCLQQQFEKRIISKRYRALLEDRPQSLGGIIQLPLRVDLDNRPRQIVCSAHGKSSMTLWHCLPKAGRTVLLYPVTGRTHQLRVHMANAEGLGIAIVGDRLYGSGNFKKTTERLMLHAELLSFINPGNQQRQRLDCKAPFSDR